MTKYWESIRERLHEESALHHPLNQIGQLFEIFFDETLNQYHEDERLFQDQGFLITASGVFLDIRGEELGLPRKTGKYAVGTVEFTLVREINQTATPVPLENEEEGGVVYDYRPEDVQTLLDRINQKRKNEGSTVKILEAREATADFIIPQGTPVYSDVGFEYNLTGDVTFKKGQKIAYGEIIAKESGKRFNTSIDSISLMGVPSSSDDATLNAVSTVNKDLVVTNTEAITGGEDGESDGEYRLRLLNNISRNISIGYLKRQGIIIYSTKSLKHDTRISLTSFNPYLANKYVLIPPNNEVLDFVKNELIINDSTLVYIKGW